MGQNVAFPTKSQKLGMGTIIPSDGQLWCVLFS